MLVADVVDGRVVELAKEYAITNLGEGVDATGELKPEAMQRVADTIDRYISVRDSFIDENHPAIKTVTVATSASRDAANADEFAQLLACRGIELSVIPGEREAALSFAGASSDFAGERIMVVDIGGGSTEVIVGEAGQTPEKSHSFNIGCRRVTERFIHSDPPSSEEMRAARAWIREGMGWFFDDLRKGDGCEACCTEEVSKGSGVDRVVAVAGTATSVVSIREQMTVYDSARVHGALVTADELREVTELLAGIPLAQRECVVGLDPKRAPVITAGMLILEETLTLAGASSFTASESDILQGIVLAASQDGIA
ncbi:MAG: Ppx/GppA family phosphatase [Eggerthellaceae bacterium]|nr:Ppx/GppA family phosphatase [Eggerthellaceae bacterium]